MTDLPVLDLKCMHFEPCRRTDKFPCRSCQEKWTVLAHAAAHQKRIGRWEKVINWLNDFGSVGKELEGMVSHWKL